MNRRTFLKAGVALAAVRGAHAAAPEIAFPTVARDRLCIATYPFRNFMDRRTHPGLKLTEFAAMAVDKFGVHNIEPMGEHFPSTEPAYLDELRAAVQKARSHIVNIPCEASASVYHPDAGKRATAVAGAKKWVDVAAGVGAPSIRPHIQNAHGGPDVGRAVDSLKQVADYGAEKQVVVTLENDDLVAEDPFFIAKVIDAVNSPWLRALPDFCNSMLKDDEEFNYKAVEAMFHRAYCIAHVKDSEVMGKKVVRVNVAKTFGIAKATGYRGYFSMEWEGEVEPYAGTQKLIDESLKALA